ncbi:MAG: zinc ribbon domain-containing protein [bacterium]
MHKFKRDYKRIVDEAQKIDPMIFIDLLIDLYPNEIDFNENFFSKFFMLKIPKDNIIGAKAQLTLFIINKQNGYENILDIILRRNAQYIECKRYNFATNEELKNIFVINAIYSTFEIKLLPVMMIFYLYGQNMFGNPNIKFYIEEYKIEVKKMEKEADKLDKLNISVVKDSIGCGGILLGPYMQDVVENDIEVFQGIAKKYKCNYDDANHVFNNVGRGVLLFLNSHLLNYNQYIHSQAEHYDVYYETLYRLQGKLQIKENKQKDFFKELLELRETNQSYKKEISKLKFQIKNGEAAINGFKNQKNINKDKQIYNFEKENNYLKCRIENLENHISEIEEASKINQEIKENIKIEENKVITLKKETLPEYQKIAVLGGFWNSRTKDELREKLPLCDIDFVEAEKITFKLDIIKNADIVIFDTSRNAHPYYKKSKNLAKKFLHINKSNVNTVMDLWRQIPSVNEMQTTN